MFGHDHVRAKQIDLLVSTELKEARKLSRCCHHSCSGLFEAKRCICCYVGELRFLRIVLIFKAKIHDVANLIEYNASEAFSHHDVIYDLVLILEASYLLREDLLAIKTLISQDRKLFEVLHHICDILSLVILAYSHWVFKVLAWIEELHVN